MQTQSTDYKTPTIAQQRELAELFCIDENLVTVVVPTQIAARPLLRLSAEIHKYKEIKKHVDRWGLSEDWLKLRLGNSIIVGKGRWKRLIKYLEKKPD